MRICLMAGCLVALLAISGVTPVTGQDGYRGGAVQFDYYADGPVTVIHTPPRRPAPPGNEIPPPLEAKPAQPPGFDFSTPSPYGHAPLGDSDYGCGCAVDQSYAEQVSPDVCYNVCCGPRWTASLEVLALDQSAPRSQTLLSDAIGGEVFNASSLNLGTQAGPRFNLIRHGFLRSSWDLEFGYFHVDSWNASAAFPAAGGPYFLAVDGNTLANSPVNSANFNYGSKLYSTELNLRRQRSDWFTVLAGFRYLEYEDLYNAAGTFAGGPYTHTVDANNHLYGFQLGADVRLWNRGGPFTVDGIVKGGIYYNAADQFSTVTAGGTSFDSAQSSHTSALVELALKANYRLSRVWSVQAGYQLMWLEGVARAPEQIPSTDLVLGGSVLNTGGSPFFHGGFAGLTASW